MSLTFRTLLPSIIMILGAHLSAQCDAIVDAGPDVTVCLVDGGINLQGSVDLAGGELLGVTWEPAGLVADPNSAVTTFTGDASTTLTFAASVIYASENLLLNPSFESGDAEFTTEYDPGMGGDFGILSAEGTYAVSTNSNLTHSNFASCFDHTTATGQMLVINGATTADEEIYCQTVTVDPNVTYALRAWVQSVVSDNPARLQFSVNGQLVGGLFSPPSFTCRWEQFDDRWDSGTNNSAEVCIVNQNTNGSGNDFALDDLYFGPVCEVEDELDIITVETEIVLDDEFTLPCNIPAEGAEISAVGSTTGPSVTYLWTADANGNIVSGETTLTPRVDQRGTYTLTLTYDDGTVICTESQTINVIPNPFVPNAVASASGVLTCRPTPVTLSSAGSSMGGSVQYFWEATVGGNIVGPSSGAFIFVDQPGTYTLTVIGFMGCSATTTVEVFQNMDAPDIDIAPVDDLSCSQMSLVIDGSASESGANVTSSWTPSNGGTILSGEDGYTPTVGSAGDYTFRLTNTITGCFTEETVTVMGASGDVNAQVAEMGEIGCDGSGSVVLSGVGSEAGDGVTYEWTTSDGTLSGPTDEITATATAAGTYILIVTAANGCGNSAFTTVTAATFEPPINLSSPEPFTCDSGPVGLEADVTTTAPITYSWTTADGQIVSGGDTPMPLIGQPGTYTLTVTNTLNNCMAIESITVDPVDGLPVANANEDQTITCADPTVFLNAAGSSVGPDFTNVYEDRDGNELSSIAVTEPGVYRLIVTNTENGCVAIDSVTILADTMAPVAPINSMGTVITCAEPELVIGTDQFGSGFTFEWSSPDGGVFIGSPGAPSVAATSAGTFTLRTTNPANGCFDERSIVVTGDVATPDLSVAMPAVIDCDNPTQQLMATNDVAGPFTYNWTSMGGAIVSDDGTLTPTISGGGVYQLIANNPATGCADTVSVNVISNGTAPPAEADGDGILTCDATQLTLNAVNPDMSGDLSYTWSTADGRFVTDSVATQVTVDQPGRYILTVRNTVTGCANTAQVMVGQNVGAPENNLGERSYQLSCNAMAITLVGVDAVEPGLEYSWAAPPANAQQTSSDETLTASVPGTYTLTIRDPANGCETTRMVDVTIDDGDIGAELSASGVIDCSEEPIDLIGGAADGGNYIYRFFDAADATIPNDELTATVTMAGRYGLIVTNLDNGCRDTAFVDVSASTTPPVAEAGDPVTIDCTNPNNFLDGGGSTLGDSITYFWTTAAGDPIATPNSIRPSVDSAGVYRLLVTNLNNNCTATDQVLVTAEAVAPPLDLARTQVLTCRETELTLSPNGGAVGRLDYTWFDLGNGGGVVSTTGQLGVSDPGEYRLSVLDPANGCTSTDTVTVSEDREAPQAGIDPVGAINCERITVPLNGNGGEGGRASTFAWSSPDGTFAGDRTAREVIATAAGAYQLIVTYPENGCADTTLINVSVDTTAPAVVLEPAQLLTCLTGPVSAAVSPGSGDDAYTYAWSSPDAMIDGPVDGASIGVDEPGTYQLTVRDMRNACTQQVEISIGQDTTSPVLNPLLPDTITCGPPVSISAAGGAAGVEYTWAETGGGNIVGPTDEATVTVDAAGEYQVTATSAANGCETTATWSVAEDTEAPAIGLVDELDLGCDPGPTILAADGDAGNLAFRWETAGGEILSGGTSASILLNGAGVYTLTATNLDNDCEASASTTVTLVTLDSFQFALAPITCDVQTARLEFLGVSGGVEPFLYSADGGESYGSGQTPRSLEPGTYELRAQDSRGCEAIDSITVDSVEALTVDLPRVVRYTIGDSTILDLTVNFPAAGLDTIVWSPARGLSCADCLRPVASPSRTTTYEVRVTSLEGCVATGLINVEVDERLGVYFPTGFSPNGDGRNDRFHPFGNLDEIVSITSFRIHDRWGNAVYEVDDVPLNDINAGWDGTFRGKFVNPAVYVYSAVVEFVSGRIIIVEGDVAVVR